MKLHNDGLNFASKAGGEWGGCRFAWKWSSVAPFRLLILIWPWISYDILKSITL